MGCYSRSPVTTIRHQDERVSLLDYPHRVRRAMHLLPVKHPTSATKHATRTQLCDAQRSLGDRPLLVFLVIPDRPIRTDASALLPPATRVGIPTQLVHLCLESLRKDSEPRRPAKCIVGLLYALKTSDVGL